MGVNAHGVIAPSHELPYDAATVLARYAAKCRRRLGMHPVADDIATAPTPWHPDILAAQAAGARMAGVYVSEPMPLPQTAPRIPRWRPYIPAGVDAQGRQPSGCRALTHEELRDAWPWAEHSRPGPLTEADLDRANEARALARLTLPELLLHKGAMTAHPAPTLWQRVRRAWTDWRISRMGPRL